MRRDSGSLSMQLLVTVDDSLLVPDSIWNKGWLETELEHRFRLKGLVDVREMDSTIRVCLKYADSSNFTKIVLYPDLNRAYLLPVAARALAEAQKKLKMLNPELSLVVYDAARPMAVQKLMWDKVRGTSLQNFVSNPARGGGLHNYGVAVDVSIVNRNGIPLDMGCEFDCFNEKARVDREQQLLKAGKLTQLQLHNRLLLRKVMLSAGFTFLSGEWWHYNLMTRQEAIRTLQVIE